MRELDNEKPKEAKTEPKMHVAMATPIASTRPRPKLYEENDDNAVSIPLRPKPRPRPRPSNQPDVLEASGFTPLNFASEKTINISSPLRQKTRAEAALVSRPLQTSRIPPFDVKQQDTGVPAKSPGGIQAKPVVGSSTGFSSQPPLKEFDPFQWFGQQQKLHSKPAPEQARQNQPNQEPAKSVLDKVNAFLNPNSTDLFSTPPPALNLEDGVDEGESSDDESVTSSSKHFLFCLVNTKWAKSPKEQSEGGLFC